MKEVFTLDYSLIKNSIAHLSPIEQEKLLNKITERVDAGKIYEESHLHSREQFKADNPPKDVVKRYKELGFDSIHLTQHGVAAIVWDFKPIAEKEGLKLVPGVETAYQEKAKKGENGLMQADSSLPQSELIIHALNDDGWKAISMAISASQTVDGLSLMSDKILSEFFGEGTIGHKNVVATTASINGPIAQIYRENAIAEISAQEVFKKRDSATGGEIPESYFKKLTDKIAELTSELTSVKDEIKEVKKVAGFNFKPREKALEKIKSASGETSQAFVDAYLKLSEDRKISKQAKLSLQPLKDESARLTKRISALNSELKEFEKLNEKNALYSEEVSEIMSKVTPNEELDNKAKKTLLKLEKIFGKGFLYVEIQNHGSEDQKRVFPKIVNLARANKTPLIASNDVHMLDNSESEMLKRQILKGLEFPKTPKWFDLAPHETEMYIKSGEEVKNSLLAIFPQDVVEEAMLNTLVLTELSNVNFTVVDHHPKYKDEEGTASEEIFMALINQGIKKKFPDGLDKEHQDRLDHEVHVMKSMGYVDYHLIVNDFNQYASEYDAIPFDKIEEAPLNRKDLLEWKKDNQFETPVGLTNGTGRGSAVGSLVCDLLGITHLDPMKYELLFERFLNPERVSMPDIDSDISRTVRPIAIDYVQDKYGKDCVAGIMTQNAQAPKGAVRIAAKSYGLYTNRKNYQDNGAKLFLSLGDKIAKAIPNTPGLSFSSLINPDEENSLTILQYLQSEFAQDKDALKIIEWAHNIEGVFTSYGSHAAGIVITDGTPVSEIVPLRWNDKLKLYTTQCDKDVAEQNGMLKFDMLGLKTVDIINDTLWEMNKSGVVIDTNHLPLNDAEVYKEIFAKGKTDSVFQFESQGMKQMLKRFKPENFEDLIILVSMFRPGPLQYLDDVIDVKHGRKPLKFLTPELEPILGATYGAITYQEQVMQIFQQLAGYTLGGADLVRRFMSKKDAVKLAKEREAFIHGDKDRNIVGCVGNGISEEASAKLFDQMTDFAKYAFNKSHAAAYAYNAYITGYLKYHYPAEFMMSAMRWSEKKPNHDPIPGLIVEAKSLGLEVLPPDINHSGENFNVENGKILFGLGSVASVASFGKEIVEERKNGKFISFFDYFKRTRALKDATKNLISAGAFDSFHSNRKAMLEIVDETQALAKKIKDKKRTIHVCEALLPFIDDLKTDQEVLDRQEELGLYKEIKKVTTSAKLQTKLKTANKSLQALEEEFDALTFPTNVKEDFSERLKAERKFIGSYITAHPMDGYEKGEVLGIESLSHITEDTTTIYGLISSVTIKKAKKNGKPMAFLTIEDEFGSVKVNVFTSAYERYKNIIEEGAVVIAKGNTKVSEVDEDDNVYYEFTANEMTLSKRKEKGLLVTYSSLAIFHLDEEENFRKKYESPTGVPVYLMDTSLKELRLMNYKVALTASKEDYVTNL